MNTTNKRLLVPGLLSLVLLLLAPGCRNPELVLQENITQTFAAKVVHDPRFEALVPRTSRVQVVSVGFEWTEGPVWVNRVDEDGDPMESFLLFSDVPANTVFQWKDGVPAREFLKPSGYTGTRARTVGVGSNGLLLDLRGRLVLCEHGDRRVSRLEGNGDRTTLAEQYQGKRLNSPNDAVYSSTGNLYFTDPSYGLDKGDEDPARELDFNGVYLLAPNGELTLLTREMTQPNGIGLSPDERTLYVANSDPEKAIWMAYPIQDDGTLAPGRVFFDATPMVGRWRGLPDGLAVDNGGNLFATGPGGVLVFSSDGTHLGTIRTGEATSNCAWGNDGSVLYLTADSKLCRIKLNTKGRTGPKTPTALLPWAEEE